MKFNNLFLLLLILFLLIIILTINLSFKRNKEKIENTKSNNEILDFIITNSSEYKFIKKYNKALYQDISNDVLKFKNLINNIHYKPSLFYYYYYTFETLLNSIAYNIDALQLNIPQDKKLKNLIKTIKSNVINNLRKELLELKKDCDYITSNNIYDKSVLDFSLKPNNIL